MEWEESSTSAGPIANHIMDDDGAAKVATGLDPLAIAPRVRGDLRSAWAVRPFTSFASKSASQEAASCRRKSSPGFQFVSR